MTGDSASEPGSTGRTRSDFLTRVETGIAATLALLVLISAPWTTLFLAIAGAALDAVRAALALAPDDPATRRDAAVGLLRATAIVAPVALAFARSRRHRLLWAPFVSMPILMALAVAPHGLNSEAAVMRLSAVSVAVMAIQRWPIARFLAIVPAVMAFHPTVTSHQGMFTTVDGLYRLCEGNPGERPGGFEPRHISAKYYSVNQVTDSRYILVGESEQHSWWMDREADGRFTLAELTSLSGNHWTGTRGAGWTWLAHRPSVTSVRWTEDGEEVRRRSLDDVRHPAEGDVLDAVYDPATNAVFASEMLTGGLLRVPVDGAPAERFPLDLFYLQVVLAEPGTLVGISTTELVTIDSQTGEVTSRRYAALCAGGLDVCPADGAAVVSDFAGRVRLFEREPSGSYRLVSSAPAPSPRRVAFSPDCKLVALTSADDHTMQIRSRDDLSVVKEVQMGPALRDLSWTDDGDLLVVDACSANRFAGPTIRRP